MNYCKHNIVESAKTFIQYVDDGKIECKKNDQLIIKHLLGGSIKDFGIIKLIDSILQKYIKELNFLDISYKSPLDEEKIKSKSCILFKVDGNILRAYLPFLTKEKFIELKDELKIKFGFSFYNDSKTTPYWWKVIRDESVFVKFKESSIINNIGYEINDADQRSLIEKIREIDGIGRKLFKLSSAKTSDFNVPPGFEEMYPFQRVAIEYSTFTNNIFITDKMGLGKTVQSLSILEYHDSYPALVVCPSVLKTNWAAEIKKWTHRTFQILENHKAPIISDIYIISYGMLSTYGIGLEKVPFRTVILDESHFVKNSKSLRSKNVKKYLGSIEKKILLTGTPILNRPIELVPQLDFLGVLDGHFGGKWEFISRYAPVSYNGRWSTYGSANEEELQLELRKCCMVRRNKKDVLDELPEKVKQVLFLPVKNKYFDIERDIVNWYKKRIFDEIESENITLTEKQIELLAEKMKSDMNPLSEKLVKLNYLKQAAAEYKLDSVFKWIDNVLQQTDKIVVFGYHKQIISKLENRYKKMSVVLKEETKKNVTTLVDEFQTNPAIKIFLSSLMIGAFGLTLTAADKLVFVELGWNPGIMEQAEDRIHRIGQLNNVNIYYLLGRSTIDEYIYEIIVNKGELIDKSTNINRIFESLQKKYN